MTHRGLFLILFKLLLALLGLLLLLLLQTGGWAASLAARALSVGSYPDPSSSTATPLAAGQACLLHVSMLPWSTELVHMAREHGP
jgi:hypothetical protein